MLRALAHLVEGAALLLVGFGKIALLERVFGLAHGIFGVRKLIA